VLAGTSGVLPDGRNKGGDHRDYAQPPHALTVWTGGAPATRLALIPAVRATCAPGIPDARASCMETGATGAPCMGDSRMGEWRPVGRHADDERERTRVQVGAWLGRLAATAA
jgi:hypothetical protein